MEYDNIKMIMSDVKNTQCGNHTVQEANTPTEEKITPSA